MKRISTWWTALDPSDRQATILVALVAGLILFGLPTIAFVLGLALRVFLVTAGV